MRKMKLFPWGIFLFFITMSLCTFYAFHLEKHYTLKVTVTYPFAGSLKNSTNDYEYYDFILPSTAIHIVDGEYVIYTIDEINTIYRDETRCRSICVKKLAEDESYVAVSGIYSTEVEIICESNLPIENFALVEKAS